MWALGWAQVTGGSPLSCHPERGDPGRGAHESPWEREQPTQGWTESSGFERRCGRVRTELREA